MLTVEAVNNILGITDSYQAPDKVMQFMLDDEERHKLFDKFIEIEYRMDYEWFHFYFQDEHAQRKTFKQDFTPQSISRLLQEMVGGGNTYHEVAAGTGGLLIEAWQKHRTGDGPFKYDPRAYWYHAEELSDRALPFLIFNMSIRGMNGVVLHGDSLTRKFNDVYFIRNETSDYQAYSEVIKMDRSQELMDFLQIYSWNDDTKEAKEGSRHDD